MCGENRRHRGSWGGGEDVTAGTMYGMGIVFVPNEEGIHPPHRTC